MKRHLGILLVAAVSQSAIALDYERDIQPIFKAKCYDCHSDEAEKVKGGLKLDDAAHFLNRFAKNDVIIPGDWDASYLFVTITRPQEAKEAMPPKNKGESLTPEEIMKVANWIHEGAKVGRDSGDAGPEDWDPEKLLRFDDKGQLVIQGLDENPADPESTMEEMHTPEVETWTNFQGKEIRATFQRVENDAAVLILENGNTVRYPVDKLDEESQKRIEKRSKP